MTTDGTITSDQQKTAGTANPVEPPTKGGEAEEEATTPTDEAEVDQLKKELVQAKKLQGQADRKARQERLARKRLQQKIQSGAGEPSSESEEDNPPDNTFQEVEKAKFEGQALRLAYSNEEYRKVLEADSTLRRIVESNPLALVKNPIDAEDAVMQLQELLDTRADEISETSPKPKEEIPKDKENKTTEETPPVGFGAEVVNPQVIPEGQHKDDLKKGNIDEAVLNKMNDKSQWNKPA